MDGQFKKETEDLFGVSWNWIRTGELKKETEGLIFTAQDLALRPNNNKKQVTHSNTNWRPGHGLASTFQVKHAHSHITWSSLSSFA